MRIMEALDKVKSDLPSDAMIVESNYEGSDIVFYTKNREFFLDNEDIVKKLVSKLKKRVEIRPHPSISMNTDDAREKIKEIVPDNAGLEETIFQPTFGKVIIRVEKPGLAIGKSGEILEKIKQETMWVPEVERIPAIDSKIVDRARELTDGNAEYRKEFLNDIGEKIRLKKSIGDEWVRVTSLGGYREVGRSSTLLQTEESKVMLDCGINPGGQGKEGYPYLNVPELDLKELDAVVLTHAHLDHCGFIPYLYEYGYEGPVYCTEPTRDLMILLQLDYIDIAKRENGRSPYDSKAIKEEVKHCITLDYKEVTDITPDMRLTLNEAGHILGSASAHLHIGEGLYNLVYSGDYNYSGSQLLNQADPNYNRIETIITESTYGNQKGESVSYKEAADKLVKTVKKALKRGGHVLIPVFAVGRSQRIMVTLSKEIRKGNIDSNVYLDGMIWDATALHTAYPEYLSKDLQNQIFHEGENPFLTEQFNRVGSSTDREKIIDGDPSIILSTSGMITGGPVMCYLDKLAEDEKNQLVFVGYQAKGTLGRKIEDGQRKIKVNNSEVNINMQVDQVKGFSGHSDRNGLVNYISDLSDKPNKVITVHGDNSSTFSLASSLHKMFNIDTTAPQNLETIRLK